MEKSADIDMTGNDIDRTVADIAENGGNNGTLIVITGPTGVGKTAAAIVMAQLLHTEIISADSRQIFREIPIGTAAPTAEELAAVRHHFVGTKSITEYFSAAQFETEVLQLLPELFAKSGYAVMCGGSMLYIDAVCRGIDEMPTISEEIRNKVIRMYRECGIECIIAQLELLDPEYLKIVDHHNEKRLLHALEICLQSGQTYTSLRTGKKKPRPFKIVKIGLNLPREQLFARINSRVDKMMEAGLEAEAQAVYQLRHLNSLNTVGFKEMFAYFDRTMDFITARERIKKNTRVYAKRQITWYAKDPEIRWMTPSQLLELTHRLAVRKSITENLPQP